MIVRLSGSLRRSSHSLPRRLLLALAAFVLGAVPYPILNAVLPPRFDFMTPLDRVIPFLPWTLIIYWSWPLLLLSSVCLLEGRPFLRWLAALLLCTMACYLGFVLFPAHYPRPSLDAIPSAVWRRAFGWLDAFDGRGNTFPSLHVALTTVSALYMRRSRHGWSWVMAAVVLSLSTVTVKQHFVADVAAGAALALTIHLATCRRAPGVG